MSLAICTLVQYLSNCLLLSGFLILFSKTMLINIKVGLSPSKKICVICLIDSPLEVMKNAFYFILKAYKFILKIHDVTTWFTNNSNTHIAKYLTK